MDLKNVISVTRLNSYIRNLFWQDEYLRQVFVQGEIANLRNYQGHLYFTLKDEKSSIKGVMWRSNTQRMTFVPEEGMQVIVAGNVSVFERDGVYQVYASYMEIAGLGALYAALEKLKERLDKEGLFDSKRKRPLPFFPRKIGLVTSIRSAAIKDVISVGRRRYPGVRFIVVDSRVQGEGAHTEIAAGIEMLSQVSEVDVIIVTRGGGSQEDLFVFNHEEIARAIYNSKVPVVSAVGHERDVTIADLVADVRAATPSAAAELVVPNAKKIQESLENLIVRSKTSLIQIIQDNRTRLKVISSRPCLQSPDWVFLSARETLLKLNQDFEKAIIRLLESKRQQFASLLTKLNALSPLNILARGYSVTRSYPKLRLIKSYKSADLGEKVLVNLHQGSLICRVEDISGDEEVPRIK